MALLKTVNVYLIFYSINKYENSALCQARLMVLIATGPPTSHST